jgi:hypothetical protein
MPRPVGRKRSQKRAASATRRSRSIGNVWALYGRCNARRSADTTL